MKTVVAAFPVPATTARDPTDDPEVQRLGLEALGAHVRLLQHAWQVGSIPDDYSKLARLCRVSAGDLERLWPEVARLWVRAREPGRLICPRLEHARPVPKEEKRRLTRKRRGSTLGVK